jgi:hypothetical protein
MREEVPVPSRTPWLLALAIMEKGDVQIGNPYRFPRRIHLYPPLPHTFVEYGKSHEQSSYSIYYQCPAKTYEELDEKDTEVGGSYLRFLDQTQPISTSYNSK